MTDLLPYDFPAKFRPGQAYTLRLTGGTAGWLDDYDFAATLGDQALTVTEDGDDLVIEMTDTVTTALATPEWSDFVLTDTTSGAIPLAGRWEPSMGSTLSPTTEVPIILGTIDVSVTLVLGPAGPGDGMGGTGDVATDTIWNAAGDLAVGTGADAAARLAKGASGTFLKAGATTLSYAALTIADTGGLQDALDAKAPTADPNFTGHVETVDVDVVGDQTRTAEGFVRADNGLLPPAWSGTGHRYQETSPALDNVATTRQGSTATATTAEASVAADVTKGAVTTTATVSAEINGADQATANLYLGNATLQEVDGDGVLRASGDVHDGTAKLANLTEVANAVAALVASAPGALDTLDELAAALGDDANFATTVTNALANKQPLDTDLTAIAALVSAADKFPYATGAGTWTLGDITSAARTFLASPTAANVPITDAGGYFGTDNTEAALAQLGAFDDALPIAQASSDIIPDAATNPGFISYDLASNPSCDALTLASHGTITSARLATIAALPACTYSNGASGVGATLTGDANGALADIDFTTPVASDRIVVANQASALQNGIYTVTTLGTAGTPFVLTRVPEADDAATWVDGITANISAGLTMRGAQLSAAGTFTMGTTSIVWQRDKPAPTPTDALFGTTRNRRRYASDFDDYMTTIAVAGGALQPIPGSRFIASLDGTGSQVVQTSDSGSIGLADCQTGTTGTGFAGIYSAHAMTFSSSAPMAWGCRLKTPTVSSGSETFIVRAGFMDFVTTTRPTTGAYFEIPSDGTSPILAVTRMSGTETATATSPSVTQGTTYKSLAIIYDEVAGSWKFYAQVSGVMTLVATNTTNLPTGSLSLGASIDKSAGTTTRSLYVDVVTGEGPDTRILSVFP